VTIIPPKVKREYRPRSRPAAAAAEPRSLAGSIPSAPVFVSGAGARAHTDQPEAAQPERSLSLEIIMRKNLLGVVA